MAANILDKITDIRNAARPNSARATGTRSAAGVSLACDNLAGWPTASKVHFVTYQVDSSSSPVAGTQLDCSGIVSGNSITSFTVLDGTDLGNSVGDYVEMLPTAAWGQDLADALTAQHSRTGTHKSLTTDTLVTTGNVTVGGTLAVTGTTTLTGVLTPSGGLSDASITPANLAAGTGSTWAWITAAAPTITAASGTITTSSATCKYIQVGKTVFFRQNITITTNGTGAGAVVSTLPITAATSGIYVASGRATSVSGKQLQAYAGATTTINIYNYDGTYPGAGGELLIINGFYDVP